MNTDEIVNDIESFLNYIKEALDEDSKKYGRLRAIKEHDSKICDMKLAELKTRFKGSDVSQTTQAKAHPEWKEFLGNHRQTLADYYTMEYKRGIQMAGVEALRSLLSFNKNRIDHDV